MKRILLWIAGVTVGAILLLALIGYLAGPQKPVADSTPTSKLDQLKATLSNHDLDLCDAYHWVESMEHDTRQLVESKYPKLAFIDREKKLEFIRDQEWKEYIEKHRLPDSLRTSINVYGLIECK